MRRLCNLVYWLYVFDQKQSALNICELIHDVDFCYGNTYRFVDITCLYGLEIRLARELFDEKRNVNIPKDQLDHCLSKSVRRRLYYPKILSEKEIATWGNDHMIYALYEMIGRGETRLYPPLNENWDKIEEAIVKYINVLKEYGKT